MKRDFSKEFKFITSRSGGAGGQNVNKVSTKVELRFHVHNSSILTDKEKDRISEKLKNRINNEGYLQIVSQEERSQLKNKLNCISKFYTLISKSLKRDKRRVPTKPSYSSVLKKVKNKKALSTKKSLRGKININKEV